MNLSPRASQMLELRGRGLSLQAIGAELNLDESVVTREFGRLRDQGVAVPESSAGSGGRPGWGWTAEREAEVKRLIGLGWSAGRIAVEIGAPTRNVVIGKVARLGLKRPEKVVVLRKGKPSEAPKEAFPSRPAAIPLSAPRVVAKRPPVVRDEPEALDIPSVNIGASTRVDAAPATAVTIYELRSDRCHWPFGDPRDEAFRYCGARVPSDVIERGRCYCAMHMKAAAAPGGRGRTAS